MHNKYISTLIGATLEKFSFGPSFLVTSTYLYHLVSIILDICLNYISYTSICK